MDIDEPRLRELRDRLDLRTIHGHGSRPDVLRQAGADDVEMLIAVTGSDEVNMVACQVCYSLYRTPNKIARIRSAAYTTDVTFFDKEHMPIDVRINPQAVVMGEIKQLLEHPGALQVLDFADGRVQLAAMRAYDDGPLVGQRLSALRDHIPNADTRVAAIFRRGSAIVPTGETVVETDDEVFFIAASEHINAVMAEFRHVERPFKRIMIAGGGNIGKAWPGRSRTLSTSRSSNSTLRVPTLPRNGWIRASSSSATPPTKDLLLEENIDARTPFAPSPTTTRSTSCPRCSPSNSACARS